MGFRRDLNKTYSALDLFVMPSHKEGLCTSIIDAQFLDIPVVATDAGGIPELVIDGETGFLAKSRDPASLGQKLITALADAKLRSVLAENAKMREIVEHPSSTGLKAICLMPSNARK